ncbi:hypothetical protein H107_02482 [Trichophyton rubrum CBS 202.88]|nr:hypothetical protein H106_02268 [Trichophyton rubrum CBS 735.88]EZG19176.1 hypothetical protein H107_02482 [Trichophyton rubrum CBS 202.88]
MTGPESYRNNKVMEDKEEDVAQFQKHAESGIQSSLSTSIQTSSSPLMFICRCLQCPTDINHGPIGTGYVIPREKLETGKLQLHCLLTKQRPLREAKYQKAAYPAQMQDANGTRSASIAVRDIHT